MKLLRLVRAVALAAALVPLAAAASDGVPGAEAPRLQPLPAPARVDPALAELGRHLFFEPRLSGDGGRSCASCHEPQRGWADGLALSRGYNGTEHFRNTPSLLSVRLKTALAWDGRLAGADLAAAVREMITEAHFMNADLLLIQERVRQLPRMMALWQAAFGAHSQPQAAQVPTAIAEYLKTLDAAPTALDRALAGEAVALAPQLRRGLDLFHGKAGCARCHAGPLGSDGRAHRLGVADAKALASEPLRQITLLRYHGTMGVPEAMRERRDLGAYAVSKQPADRGRFLTPSLRGLVHSAPYMHNGSLATLEDVVAFHARGGGPGSELAPVKLAADERAALVALLRALSGPPPAVEVPATSGYAAMPGVH